MEGKKVIVLGAGLSGLSAAYELTRQGASATVIEKNPEVGGLARTIERDGYRFDFGGYRFIGGSSEIRDLFKELLGPDLLTVTATSKIYYRGYSYAYPLEVKDLVKGLGQKEAAVALWTYAGRQIAGHLPGHARPRNLEEWLLERFGETLYRAFFRDYSEKIWGIACHRLSAELASRRIRGVELGKGLVRRLLPRRLAGDMGHRFLYPKRGIGQLSDALAERIERKNELLRDGTVTEVRVRRGRVKGVTYRDRKGDSHEAQATHLVSSIPLPRLLYILSPRPPADVLASARALLFRDVISVCLKLRREQVTRDSWIYAPDPQIGFARLLEPRNWSRAMVPVGKSSLVAETYCFEGDPVWSASDEELIDRTVQDLSERMALIRPEEVLGGVVLRIRKPYPVYELGYHEHLTRIHRFLSSIVNLQAIGRGGMFKYYNVGHLVRSGIRAAENVFGAGHDLWGVKADDLSQARLFKA